VGHPKSGVILLAVSFLLLVANLGFIVPRGRKRSSSAERLVYVWGWGVAGTLLLVVLIVIGIVVIARGA
jgi:hypothetical protein